MATTPKVLLKRSSQAGRVPAAGDLDYGELALNFADGKIYYKDNTNTINAFVDSARVQAIADAVEVVAQAQLDSGEVTSLVDSAYVQTRVPLSYLESLIDSAYVQARQIYYTGFDSDFDARLAIKTTDDLTEGSNLYYTKARVDSDIASSLTDSGNVVNITINNTILDTVDSAYVNARVNAANYLDSAEAIQLIDSAYVQARQITYDFLDSVETVAIIDSHVNTAFVDALNINADRLDGQHGNYYRDWNNVTNKPTILDLVDVSTQITADVDKAFVDALNVDADTVDGYHAQAFFDAIDSAVDALIDGAPGALDTLNELAQALNDDSNAYNNLLSLIAAKLDSAEAIALIDSAHVRARQDYAYSSLTGVPTNVSSFTNDANYLDSNTVVPIIDSAYVQARQLNFDNLLDSAEVTALVDSAYVQARQDYAYSSLTGVPTNVSQFTNDANYLDSATVQNVIDATYIQANQTTYDFLDSAEVTNLVDSAYVQARQDFAYGSLTGVPTNVSSFTNDANYLDSSTVQGVIDSAYIKARTDSAYVTNIIDNATSVFVNNVDSAYVQARQITYNTSNFTDSAFVTGLPVSTFTNDANYIATGDSASLASVTTTGDVIVGGNLQVTGTTTTVNSEDLNVTDNMIYMNAGESSGSPTADIDVGWAANVNDNGSYTHVGMFRDATDDTFKVFGNYTPEPDASVQINTGHASFELAPFAAKTLTGKYLGFDSDLATKTTTDVAEGFNLYYTKARVDSDITASLNDSGNTVNITINNTITDTVDSAYVLARVAEAPFLDSADAIAFIDSAYVQQRQDYAYSSLTGTPTIPTLGNDFVDSAFVTGLPVSTFTNDANYLDSTTVQGVIDASYIQANQTTYDFLDSAETIALIDSAYILARSPAGIDSALVVQIIDSAYVQARQSGVDSAAIIQLVDSAYVIARAGASTDSATVSAIIINDVDSAYIQARQLNEVAAELTQTTYNFIADSGQSSFTGLNVDSGKFQVYLNGLLLPRADYTHNSSKVDLLVAADSGDVLEVIKFSGNDTGATAIQQRHYIYTATSGQTVFTGADDNGATLSYTQNRINVYLNGLLLLDSADYTQNGAGTVVTFTSGVTAGHIVDIQTLTGNTGSFSPLEQTLYEFTADSGQTVFTGTDNNSATLDFSNDKVTVYLNGILLSGTDYTLSSGNTVTLDVGADSGNLLTVAKLSGNNIGLDSAQVNALIGASAPSGVDSAAIIALVDSAYVQARTLAGTDSAATQAMIDSNFLAVGSNIVPAVDSTYDLGTSSKKWKDLYLSGNTIYLGGHNIHRQGNAIRFIDSTGTPIDIVAANIIDSADVIGIIASETLDSALITALVDSAYIQLRDRFQDSAGVIQLVDSALVQLKAIGLDYNVLSNTPAAGLSNVVEDTTPQLGGPLDANGNDIFLDDNDFIGWGSVGRTQIKGQSSTSYSTNHITFNVRSGSSSATEIAKLTTDDGIYTTIGLNFANWNTALNDYYDLKIKGPTSNSLSANETIRFPESSGTVALTKDLIDSADIINLIDSAYIQARQTSGGGGTVDSAYVLSVVDSAVIPFSQTFYHFTADSGQLTFSGFDDDSDILAYTAGALAVYLNGILLVDSVDYTANDGTSIILQDSAALGDILTVLKFGGNTTGLDSANVINLIDSAYIQARQADIYRDSAFITNIIDSAYVIARTSAGTDSATVIALIEAANDSDRDAGTQTRVFRMSDTSELNTLSQHNGLGTEIGVVKVGDIAYTTNPLKSFVLTNIPAPATGTYTSTGFRVQQGNGTVTTAHFDIVPSGQLPSENFAIGMTVSRATYAADLRTITAVYDTGGTYGKGYVEFTPSMGGYPPPWDNKYLHTDPVNLTTWHRLAFDSSDITAIAGSAAGAGFDSAGIIALVDSAYVQARVPESYLSTIIDSAYVEARQSNVFNRVYVSGQDEFNADSTRDQIIFEAGAGITLTTDANTDTLTITSHEAPFPDSASVVTVIENLVDSAYVQLRQSTVAGGGGGTDSATVVTLIQSTVDSDYIGTKVDFTRGEFVNEKSQYTATASQTVFNHSSIDPTHLDVYLNGILQVVDDDYTATSSAVTFTSGVDSGYSVTIVEKRGRVLTQRGLIESKYYFTTPTPITSITGADDNGNTLDYSDGFLDVYLNGILLKDSDDYSTNAGTTVTLVSATDSNDLVTLINRKGVVVTPNVKNYEFTATAGQTTFSGTDINGNTLAYVPGATQVFLNGILLRNVDYTGITGTSIVLVDSASLNDELVVSAFSNPGQNMDLYKFTADSGQTIFSGNDLTGASLAYQPGNIQVFMNGLLLNDSDDYTASNGMSVVLTSGADLSDEIKIASFVNNRDNLRTNAWSAPTDSTVQASAGDKLFIDVSSSAKTVTLPSSASMGDEIRIIDVTGNAATNNITVGRNGHNIQGSATDLTININRAGIGLVYYNAAQGWVLIEN